MEAGDADRVVAWPDTDAMLRGWLLADGLEVRSAGCLSGDEAGAGPRLANVE